MLDLHAVLILVAVLIVNSICRFTLNMVHAYPPSCVYSTCSCFFFPLMQKVELKAEKILWVGKCDSSAGKYPLSKKGQSMESLRERLHLRPRTNLIGAVARIRNALAHATHTFFQSRGFLYVHTPIITTSDCEGAGEMFQVYLDTASLHVPQLPLDLLLVFSILGLHSLTEFRLLS